jgi:hypothetical protein
MNDAAQEQVERADVLGIVDGAVAHDATARGRRGHEGVPC